ncbi:MAG: hypothetical protein CVT95_05530 [Bacteroidetes bacterium HGW-Bacteroidetes-12]|nr:MAG: hypothetical protein CVT95_05530 [Bacteroidetes bacterium HGW-Bacteroidetes-12]
METKKESQALAINKQTVKGNLAAEPNFKETKSGHLMAEFSVAHPVKRKTGIDTNYISVVAFGDKAEEIKKLGLDKGAFVEVSGKANFYELDGKAGKHYQNAIIANQTLVLEKGVKPTITNHNEIEIKGNLTADPEFVNKGDMLIANLRLANNHKTTKEGENKVMFYNVSLYGKTAEMAEQNKLSKGDTVGVKGSVENGQFATENGNRYTTKVNAGYIELNSSKEQVIDAEHAPTVDLSAEKSEGQEKKRSKEMSM